MALPAFFTRRSSQGAPQSDPAAPAAEPQGDPDVLMRFLNQGGAVVELRSHRFKTQYTWRGRPYVSDEVREVDGFVWQCLGCETTGDGGLFNGKYLPDERQDARNAANKHAAECRAMPGPAA